MTIGEIAIKLGFKADTFTLKDFSKTIGDLPMKAVTAAVSIAGVSLEITSLIKGAMEAAGTFQLFTAATGLSSAEMQRWRLVAEQVSVSVGAVESSFRGVDRALKNIKSGVNVEATMKAFNFLHVDPRGKDANQLMEEIRKNIKTLNPRQLAFAQTQGFGALGIDQDLIMRFGQMSRKEFNSRGSVVGVQTEAEIKAAAELTSAFAKMAETIRRSVIKPMEDFAKVMNELTPVLKKMIPPTYQIAKAIYTNLPGPAAAQLLLGGPSKGQLGFMVGAIKFAQSEAKLAEANKYKSPFEIMVEKFDHTFGNVMAVARTVHNDNDLNLTQHNYFSGDTERAYRFMTDEARQRIHASKFFGNGG